MTSGNLQIRRMSATDAEAVAELAGELGYPCTSAEIKKRMEAISEKDLLLVAINSADKPVGFIQANRIWIIEVGYMVEIVGLVVSATARRAGIGRRLIAEVESWAKSVGAPRVIVRSNTKRTESHRFYPALGYNLIKTQAVYEKQLGSV